MTALGLPLVWLPVLSRDARVLGLLAMIDPAPGWLLAAHADRFLATGMRANCGTRVRYYSVCVWCGDGGDGARGTERRLEGGWQVGAMCTPVSSRRAGTDDLSFNPARTTTRNRLAIHRSDAPPKVQRIDLSTHSASIPRGSG